jgi:putative nucleotidyltransferase with HDIG domain
MELKLVTVENSIDGNGDLRDCPDVSVNSDIKSFPVASSFLTEQLSGVPALGHLSLSEHGPDASISFPIQIDDRLGEAEQLADQLDRFAWEVLKAFARAVDASSPWTANHSERVASLAIRIGAVVGLSPKDLDVLRCAALLHDIGKLGVSASILDKPGSLTNDERRCVEQHPQIGANILEPITTYAEIIPIVLQHHEQFFGTGYPDGLAGEAICIGARILSVADVFDALASKRPYRARWKRKCAVGFIKQGIDYKFDPKVIEAFLEVMAQEEVEGRFL